MSRVTGISIDVLTFEPGNFLYMVFLIKLVEWFTMPFQHECHLPLPGGGRWGEGRGGGGERLHECWNKHCKSRDQLHVKKPCTAKIFRLKFTILQCRSPALEGYVIFRLSAKTWHYIKTLIEQSWYLEIGHLYSYFNDRGLLTKTKLKKEYFKQNYTLVLNLFLNVFLMVKFWASGFCWHTL